VVFVDGVELVGFGGGFFGIVVIGHAGSSFRVGLIGWMRMVVGGCTGEGG
jgi:hypothetical protein